MTIRTYQCNVCRGTFGASDASKIIGIHWIAASAMERPMERRSPSDAECHVCLVCLGQLIAIGKTIPAK